MIYMSELCIPFKDSSIYKWLKIYENTTMNIFKKSFSGTNKVQSNKGILLTLI